MRRVVHKHIFNFHVQRSSSHTVHVNSLFVLLMVFSTSSPAILIIRTRTSTEFSAAISKKYCVMSSLHIWSSLVGQLLLLSTHITEDIWHYFGCRSKCVWTCLGVSIRLLIAFLLLLMKPTISG